MYCLSQLDMLCLGVFRCKDDLQQCSQKNQNLNSIKRYVICNPAADFHLIPTDIIYVLEQFSLNKPEERKLSATTEHDMATSPSLPSSISNLKIHKNITISNISNKNNSSSNSNNANSNIPCNAFGHSPKILSRSYSNGIGQYKRKTHNLSNESIKIKTETTF